MKEIFSYTKKLFVFWLVFFAFQRVEFLVYEHVYPEENGFSGLLLSLLFGLRYDLSAACILTVIPFFIIFAASVIRKEQPRKILSVYHYIAISLSSVTGSADMELFRQWGTRLNGRAFSYMAYPEEAIASVSSSPLLLLLPLLLLQIAGGIYLWKKITRNGMKAPVSSKLAIPAFLIFSLLFFVGIRGGIQRKPLTKLWGYFSKQPALNQATINTCWSLFYELTSHPAGEGRYHYFTSGEAKKKTAELFRSSPGRFPSMLSLKHPNIIFIILESWSADVIGSLGGEKNVAVEFDKLAREGVLFTDFYASGFRTDQGLPAILSGFPAQPRTSIIKDFGKFERLPGIIKSISRAMPSYDGHTSAYYGGDLGFANTGNYFTSLGIKKLTGQNDFRYKGKTMWGAYDEDLFMFQVHDTGLMQEPFVSLILTISSHEPFDAPGEAVFKGISNPQKYRNAIHYTDRCLGMYFEEARKQPWFKNTLFVLISDHGHIYPYKRIHNVPGRYKIAMLLYGDAIRQEYRGTSIDKTGSQTDIPAVILSQLGIGHDEYHWSKNILDSSVRPFAFYTFDDGFGWLTPRASFIFDNTTASVERQRSSLGKKETQEQLDLGKAYMQTLIEEYQNY